MSPASSSTESAVLLVFGAGGHGRVVADAAFSANCWSRVIASDRNTAVCHGELLPGVVLLDEASAKLLKPLIHIAIGNNQARERESGLWGSDQLVCVVHPTALISTFSHIADGCFVAAGAIVGPNARIGMGVIVNHGAVIDHDVNIGAFSHIAPNATLGGSVKVGQRVLIGAGAVVLPSVVIADDVVVGAGTVVPRDLLQAGTYVGVPARRMT